MWLHAVAYGTMRCAVACGTIAAWCGLWDDCSVVWRWKLCAEECSGISSMRLNALYVGPQQPTRLLRLPSPRHRRAQHTLGLSPQSGIRSAPHRVRVWDKGEGVFLHHLCHGHQHPQAWTMKANDGGYSIGSDSDRNTSCRRTSKDA